MNKLVGSRSTHPVRVQNKFGLATSPLEGKDGSVTGLGTANMWESQNASIQANATPNSMWAPIPTSVSHEGTSHEKSDSSNVFQQFSKSSSRTGGGNRFSEPCEIIKESGRSHHVNAMHSFSTAFAQESACIDSPFSSNEYQKSEHDPMPLQTSGAVAGHTAFHVTAKEENDDKGPNHSHHVSAMHSLSTAGICFSRLLRPKGQRESAARMCIIIVISFICTCVLYFNTLINFICTHSEKSGFECCRCELLPPLSGGGATSHDASLASEARPCSASNS